METTKKNDFIELVFTGRANDSVFDSNDPVVLKQLGEKEEPRKWIVIVGAGMVVSGLDKALEGKEIGKEYQVKLSVNEAFGVRKRELVKTIPLRVFTEQKLFPQAGMTLSLDGMIARISAVSGSRVITDFNNPLAGKELFYNFKVVRKVEEVKERAETFFAFFLKFNPEIEIKDTVIIKAPQPLEPMVMAFKEKFQELVGKPLTFQAKELPKKETASKEVETQQSL